MYDLVQGARDDGVHLGFFSGDTLYWQMRLEDEAAVPGDSTHAVHDRVMVVYRNPYPPTAKGLGDPNPDQTQQTIYWRDVPVARDEEALVGVHFTHPLNCREHVAAWASTGRPPAGTTPQVSPELSSDPQPMTVIAANHWVFAGSGAKNGTTVPNVYGQESDVADANRGSATCGQSAWDPPAVQPRHLGNSYQVLTSGAFNNKPLLVGQPNPGVDTVVPVNSTIYQACSQAWVFAAGDIMWGNTLGPSLLLGKDYSNTVNQQMTLNVLNVFAGLSQAPASGSNCVAPLPEALLPAVLSTLD
jgi:hypothetical protein